MAAPASALRNRIVHDYLNVDMAVIETLIKEQKYQLQVQFLLAPIENLRAPIKSEHDKP